MTADAFEVQAMPASDAAWLTLCVYEEARNQPQDGKAAVAKVVLNRTRRKPPFFSDGTIKGTILHPSQFSWVEYDMVDGHYTKVAHTPEQVEARVGKLYTEATSHHLVWSACADPAASVVAGTYVGGPAYDELGDDALLYCNLAVSQPPWATPEKLICRIGAHSFYRP